MEPMSNILIFAKHFFGFSDKEKIVFSPFLKNIVRIVSDYDQNGKELSDVYIYKINKNHYDNKNVTLLYHQQYFGFSRIIFSDDGKQLLLSTDNCIYIFWFDKGGVHEGGTISFSELYKTSNIFKIDFVAYDVELVQLKNNSFTLCLNRHWLLDFQFNSHFALSLNYCVQIANDVLLIQLTKDKIHCLTSYGKIFSYDISSGLLSSIFNVYSVLPKTVRVEKFVVNRNSDHIALYNGSDTVYILQIPEQDISGHASVKSNVTSVSRMSTYSRTDSVRSNNYTKLKNQIPFTSSPSSWISHLEKLSLRNKKECSVFPSKTFISIRDLPANTVVKAMQFYSCESIALWCVSEDSVQNNLYRVYGIQNGQLEMSETLQPDIRVIPLNCPGISLDVFASPSTLSLPLVFTSKEVLVNKLLNCVGSDCVAWLLELDTSLSQSMRPLSLLNDGLKDSQLHLVRLSLNLHFQEMKRELSDEVVDTTKVFMDQMIAVVQNEAAKEPFTRKMYMEVLIFANKILSLLKSNSVLKFEVLKRLVHLRSALRKHQPLPTEEPLCTQQWSTWEVLSDKEIVKEGVKDLPLVHCFLILRRSWSAEDISGRRFKLLVISIVTDFLLNENLPEAEDFFIKAGYCPNVEFPLMCKNTLNRCLRDYLMSTLAEAEAETEACKFIIVVESILDRYTNTHSLMDSPIGLLTLSNVMSYSSELRTYILTDLYFNTQDSTLLKYLDKDVCWDYLLEYNCVEAIDTIKHILEWPITQDVVDRLGQGDEANSTVETVLNQLARCGIFLSSEKCSCEMMIKRLAYCKLLLKYKDILKTSPTNLLYEDFNKVLLNYAVQHDLLDVVLSLPQPIDVGEVKERAGWFTLWKVFMDWEKEGVTKLLSETTNYLATSTSLSSYLRKHPFVNIATNLFEYQEISRVDAGFSPIISAITATGPLLNDISVYSFLTGTIPFYTDNLFQFQSDQNRIQNDTEMQILDFSDEKLSKKYGHSQSLRFTDRLKQGRPGEALIQLFDKSGRIAVPGKKHACNAAHGLALYHTVDSVVTTSCIAFMEMLGRDSNLLRTHLAASVILQKNRKKYDVQNLKLQLYKIVLGSVEEIFGEIEHSLEEQWKDEQNTLLCLRQNQVMIRLAALHGLPPSYTILKYAAESNNWLLFVLASQIFQYPLAKVQQLVAAFTCSKLQEHLYFALALEPLEQCEMGSIATGSLDENKVNAGSNSCILRNKSELFVNIAQCNNNAQKMLNLSSKVGNPVLALLAPCLKLNSGIMPFCRWLISSMRVSVTLDEPCTPDKVLEILELAVQLGYVRILARAFLIFFPDNPLQIFTTFLVDTVVEKRFQSGILSLKSFKASYMNLPDKTTGHIIGFMKNKTWIANTAVRMASTALVYCFKSVHHQNCYLQVLADSLLSVTSPDYTLILRLSNCLANTDITLDYAQLCLHNDQSHLIHQLQLLIERKNFQTAFRFASTAGLSLGPVHIADWNERARTEERLEPGFWDSCQSALNKAMVEPQLAAEFYKKQAARLVDPQDKFVVLKYALEWMKKLPADVKWKNQESSVHLDLYFTALQQGFKIEMVTQGMTYTPLHCLTTDLKSKSLGTEGVPKLTLDQHYKLDSLIHGLLEVGDVMTVVILQDMFQHVNQDFELVLACMSLAEGKSVHQLPQMIQGLLNVDSSSPRYMRKKTSALENQRLVNCLYALQAHQTCATPLFRNIINAYKVSCLLGLDYKMVITHQEPFSLLKVEDDFEVARYIFTLASLTESELTQYLAEQLTSVLHEGPVEGIYTLWGCDLNTQFIRLLSLDGIIPLMLGNLLLSSVPRLDSKQPSTLREAVELVIRSHDCFTKACNMEGISSVLTISRDLVNLLLDCCQWTLMVRLLTGVGRYTEMKYIFQILKDRDQFECLLGKGLDKCPALMSAMLDFVRNDKPCYMLVALHFCMYSELAALFKEEASNELEKLEHGPEGSMMRSHHNKHCLQVALNKYADATNHYIQANKQKQGVVCVQQAELIALQLSLITVTPPSDNVHCLINQSPDQVTSLILKFLSYEEACIVSTAYNLTVDWSAALYYHCIVRGETAYLNSWCQHNHFTLSIVQDVARRFQNSNSNLASRETNMKWFLSSVNQVDIKYRVCSQLGFKDLLQTILSGPDLAYLKDTVWQRGFVSHFNYVQ